MVRSLCLRVRKGQLSSMENQRTKNRRTRGQKSEVRGQRSEVRGQRSEVRGQRSEGRGQRSEVRGQRSFGFVPVDFDVFCGAADGDDVGFAVAVEVAGDEVFDGDAAGIEDLAGPFQAPRGREVVR